MKEIHAPSKSEGKRGLRRLPRCFRDEGIVDGAEDGLALDLIHASQASPPASDAALALYFAYYNFVRIHSTLRVTPAMESGLAEHIWTSKELLSKMGQ